MLKGEKMAKYVFKVFSYEDKNKQIAQVVTRTDEMIETIKFLNTLGIVKGFILDDDDKELEK